MTRLKILSELPEEGLEELKIEEDKMAATVEKNRIAEAPVERVPGATLKTRLTEYLGASRRPGEILKVAQVGTRNFRVNWLSPVALQGEAMVIKSYRLTKSQYLAVDELHGELVITDKTIK